MNRAARVITDAHRRAIFRTLDAHAKAGSFSAIRTRAFARLQLEAGLRLDEVLALELAQLAENWSAAWTTKRGPRIVSTFYLRRDQAKGRDDDDGRGYSSERMVRLAKAVRGDVAAYLAELHAKGWLEDRPDAPVWITIKGRGEERHSLIGERAIQAAWHTWQARAGIVDAYRTHDLRHTALTRWSENGDAFAVAELAGHRDVRTSARYVHKSPRRLAEIVERGAVTELD